MASAGLNQSELTDRVDGYKRHAVRDFILGHTANPEPDMVNRIAKELGIPIERMLRAMGYDVALTPQRKVSSQLAAVWEDLPPDVKAGIVQIAQGAANLRSAGVLLVP